MNRSTLFFSTSDPAWTVYRVQTQASVYHVAVFKGDERRRRCVTLRGDTVGEAQDSDPRINDASLFDVPVTAWVGKSLEVGLVTTSPVQVVEVERDVAIVRALTAPPVRRRVGDEDGGLPPAQRESIPYPESAVVLVESGARRLSAAYEQRTLVEDLAAEPELLDRLRIALADCYMRVEAMGRRLARDASRK